MALSCSRFVGVLEAPLRPSPSFTGRHWAHRFLAGRIAGGVHRVHVRFAGDAGAPDVPGRRRAAPFEGGGDVPGYGPASSGLRQYGEQGTARRGRTAAVWATEIATGRCAPEHSPHAG